MFSDSLTNICSDHCFLIYYLYEKDNICNMMCSKNNELISSVAPW